MAAMKDIAVIDGATQPRARGALRIGVGPRGLTALRQSGALKALFPHRGSDEAVVVNTAGGITGGDRFRVVLEVAPGARLTVTTQAAERAYAAQPDETGQIEIDARVSGELCWLPQETIIFDRSRLSRHMRVEMDAGARVLWCEQICFGRLARGETLRDVRFRDRVEIRRGGRAVYLDGLDLTGDVFATLDRPAVAAGGRAMASLVLAGPDAEGHLAAVRALLPAMGGASMLGADVLVARIVAADGYDLRVALAPILRRLSGRDLPAVWRS